MYTKKAFDEILHTSEDEKVELWYARELMRYLGYDRSDHFRGIMKMVPLGSGAERGVKEYPCKGHIYLAGSY